MKESQVTKTKRRCSPSLCLTLLTVAGLATGASALPAGSDTAQTAKPDPGSALLLAKVADGVYCATSRETAYFVANSVVIVGDESVLVVDSGASPAGARSLVQAIRTVSDRPIRYLVDTHFHFDHAFGNGAFGADTLVISHEATRALLGPEALRGRAYRGFADGLPARIERLRAQAAGEPVAEKRRQLADEVAALEAYSEELAMLVPLPPRLTLSERVTVDLGNREVQLLYLGRGHTAGDVVVFLPRERIVCTGDLFNGYIGYMGDAYVDEWADSLDRLVRLDFETVIPGHGAPFTGKAKVAPVQACLRDLWRQAADLKRSRVPADQAAPRIDLRAHASQFPQLAELGFTPVAVRRIYEVLDERAAGR
jgi:glyoxylase-like metal-dependent hydrolase (beta-lactamase superfamily II)